MASGKQRPTIYSIARELGVHASTVSRALTRPDMVRPEVRDAVRAKAEELGYRSNPVARGLITGRTGVIGLLIPDVENPFFAPLIRSVQHAATDAGSKLLLMDAALDPVLERNLVAQVRDQVDGLILAAPRAKVQDLVAVAGSLPQVLVNRTHTGVVSVNIDNASALRQACDHLYAQGHRRILLLRGPARSWAALQRTKVVRQWARTADVELVEAGPIEAQFDGGYAAAPLVLKSRASALVAFDDLMACGVIAGLANLGCAVPSEVSVVGCDDVPLARMVTPPLTTIRAPFEETGVTSVGMLTGLISGKSFDLPVQLPGVLVVRGSTGSAPGRLADS